MEPEERISNAEPTEVSDSKPLPARALLHYSFGIVAVTSISAGLLVWWLLLAPSYFEPMEVVIEPGQSVSSIADELAANNVVKSGDLLYLTLQILHKDTVIKAGTYTFTAPASTAAVARYITSTTPADELLRLTLPEGMRAREYAILAATIIEDFDETWYTTAGEAVEGYLWPETYFVPLDFTAADLIALQQASSQTFLLAEAPTISAHPLSEYEIVTLASIVEREANTRESMRTVAGILLNRLALGMALQADATIEYVLDTPLGELPPGVLATELRERDSPYNSYLYPGLPPTPISNPGRQALEAVLNPIESNYLFYITGDDGAFYYAENFDTHRLNISRHLR